LPPSRFFIRCQDIFKVGDNKYEIRVGGQVTSVFQRLLR
jgi:hypothetical protein